VTLHRVDHPLGGQKGGGRWGPCIDAKHPAAGGNDGLSAAQRKKREKTERAHQNPRLF